MTEAIFADDSTPADKRDAAFERLYAMCPAAMRLAMRPFIQQAINAASDDEIASLMLDVDRVQAMAESGDMQGVTEIAKRYGATDDQVAQVAAMLPSAR